MSNEWEMREDECGCSTRRRGRREFLRSAGRLGVLGALGALGAALAGQSRDEQACSNDGICGACTAFNRCGLPLAVSARRQRGTQAAGPTGPSSLAVQADQAAPRKANP